MNSRYNYNRRRYSGNGESSGAAASLAFAIFGTLAIGIWTATLKSNISSLEEQCEDLRRTAEHQQQKIDSLTAKPVALPIEIPPPPIEKPRVRKAAPKDTSKAEKPTEMKISMPIQDTAR